jgi:hypothetical protein
VPAGPQAAASRICATSSRSLAAGPQRIDANDVIITPVEGPCLLDRWGGYVWTVTYRLPFAAAGGGFMIQELYQQTSSGGNLHFWECWRVRAGDQEPADRADNWDDRYRNFNPNPELMAGSSGWKRHVGVIRFYPGPLPAQFGTESPTTHFYTTQQRPDGWTGAGTRHDCYSQWDDAPGHRHFAGLVAVAGNTEWRAGAVVNDSTPRPQIGPTP